MMLSTTAFLVVWIGLMAAGLRTTLVFLREHGLEGMNYRKERIPVGLGLFLWISAFLELFLRELWHALGLQLADWIALPEQSYFFMLTVLFLIGWMDDTIGDARIKGLRGHVRHFITTGGMSTGLAKAAVTGCLALWAAVLMAEEVIQGVMMFGVILLSTNVMNMLDLRPGRALKGYFLLAGLLLSLAPYVALAYLLPILSAALLVFSLDLRAKAMLGDMGANLLGFSVGFAACVVLPFWGLAAWLFVATWLHWAAERVSFSRVIEQSRVLSWIDQAGRREKGDSA